ncbi:MAG: T9SS type A sorting domain-containing protein, partial [Ginsengibacter sp.]
KWTGNKDQTYILKASYTDAAANNLIEIEGTKTSCDNNANCTGAISVKEGVTISWNVQAICSTDGVILYSSQVNGPDAYIPYCVEKRTDAVKENAVHVYPNPAANYLMVEFDGNITGAIQFRILDIAGKKVFDKMGDAVLKTGNQYKLDLRKLIAGTYLLEVHNGNLVNQTKFVLLKN